VILVIVDRITKWGYFILCREEISVKDIVRIYVKKVFLWYGLLEKIILDWDSRFIVVF